MKFKIISAIILLAGLLLGVLLFGDGNQGQSSSQSNQQQSSPRPAQNQDAMKDLKL